jgi:hypothetical protein
MEQFIEPVDLNQNVTLDDLDCPICGSKAVIRFFYDTAEEQIDCYSCGYLRKFYITNLEDKDNHESEFEWIPEYSIEEKEGFGAYSVRMLNSDNTEVGSFATEQSQQYFLNTVEQLKDQIAYAKYTTFVDGKLEEVIVINTVE